MSANNSVHCINYIIIVVLYYNFGGQWCTNGTFDILEIHFIWIFPCFISCISYALFLVAHKVVSPNTL